MKSLRISLEIVSKPWKENFLLHFLQWLVEEQVDHVFIVEREIIRRSLLQNLQMQIKANVISATSHIIKKISTETTRLNHCKSGVSKILIRAIIACIMRFTISL